MFVGPHQYATRLIHLFVNCDEVQKDGGQTGATPGRVVRGPGWVEPQVTAEPSP